MKISSESLTNTLTLFERLIVETVARSNPSNESRLLNEMGQPADYFIIVWTLLTRSKKVPAINNGDKILFLRQATPTQAFQLRITTLQTTMSLRENILDHAISEKQLFYRKVAGLQESSKSIINHLFDCCYANKLLRNPFSLTQISKFEENFLHLFRANLQQFLNEQANAE
ncbi:MAG TPA: hypothetical protein VGE63_01295 [Candidatus Paceibacterota bacterium]